MPELKITPEWLRAVAAGRPIGVDREKKTIRGYVVAQRGDFKTGRGHFDDQSLGTILKLMNEKPGGLKSRFTHPTLSSDGLGTHLGRSTNAFLDGDRVRADLHLDDSSFKTPNGDLGSYVMDLAASDPDALSSSLVLKTEKIQVLDDRGKPKTDEKGEPLPPIWRPTKLHASDIVDTGDAVDGLLSVRLDATGLPDELVRRGAELLDGAFAGQSREVVEARCSAWLSRYLAYRFGESEDGEALRIQVPLPGNSIEDLRLKAKQKQREFEARE